MEHSSDFTATALACADFTCDAKALADSVAFLARRVIDARVTVPIYAHVLISADPAGGVTVTGAGKDMAASVTIAANVESPGAFCVEAANLAAILAKLAKAKGTGNAHVTDSGNNRVSIRSSRAAMNAPTLPIDNFPAPFGGIAPAPDAVALNAARFLGDLSALSPAMSTEEARHYLNGVQIERRDMAGRDSLVLVSCNGGNMAIASREAPEGMGDMPGAILSGKAVAVLIAAGKLAGDGAPLSWEYDPSERNGVFRFQLGNVALAAKAIDGTFPQWERAWTGMKCAGDAEPCLFPELLPGAPVAMLEKLAKPFKGALSWEYRGNRYIGSVAGDPGLAFLSMGMAESGCGKKGFDYALTGHGEAQAYLMAVIEARGLPLPAEIEARVAAINAGYGETYSGNRPWGKAEAECRLVTRGDKVLGYTVSGIHRFNTWRETVQDWEALIEREVYHEAGEEAIEGAYSIIMPADGPGRLECESAIVGPDGVTYPVAMSDKAIHLSKEQVRALIGESCFETMEIALPDGRPAHVLKWLWEQGDSRFLTVRADGRTYPGGVYVTRAEIEAGPAAVELEAFGPPCKVRWIRNATATGWENPDEICTIKPLGADDIGDWLMVTDGGRGVNWRLEDEGRAWQRVTMPEISASEPAQDESAAPVAHDAPEALDAPYGPEIAPDDPVSDAETLPAPEAVKECLTAEPPAADAMAALVARIEALEARLAPLPVESEAAPIGETEPARPRRTAAHERMVRRAWAERREARLQRAIADDHMRMREEAQRRLASEMAINVETRETFWREQDKRHRAVVNARRRIAALQSEGKRTLRKARNEAQASAATEHRKRKAAVLLARDMQKRIAIEYRLVDKLTGQKREAFRRLAVETEARLQAETALAAVQARASGRPPAVRPVSVNVSFAGAIAA